MNCTYMEGVSKFKKKFKFLRSLQFFENENFFARAADFADFLELSS